MLKEVLENEEKRYVVTIDFYLYENDDKSAIKEAAKIAKNFDRNMTIKLK